MTRYDNQFKEEAVRLAKEIGTRRAAEQLGISYHTLSDWRQSNQKNRNSTFAGDGRSNGTIAELTPREKELQLEVDELRRANEILKDALGFFAKDRKR